MAALSSSTRSAAASARASFSGRSHVPAVRGVNAVPTSASPAAFRRYSSNISGKQLVQQQRPARGVACRGLFGLGLPELAVIAGVAALIFGPSKLPELGKGLGKTVKSFQSAAKEFETELKAAAAPDEEQPKEAEPVKKE